MFPDWRHVLFGLPTESESEVTTKARRGERHVSAVDDADGGNDSRRTTGNGRDWLPEGSTSRKNTGRFTNAFQDT